MNDVLDEVRLEKHHANNFPEQRMFSLRHEFARNGFIKVRDIVDDGVRESITAAVNNLIERQLERRDLHLATTDNTPRYMSVVRSEFIAENSPLINTLSKSEVLLDTLSVIAGTRVVPSVSRDEEYLITQQERKGDTHGWHCLLSRAGVYPNSSDRDRFQTLCQRPRGRAVPGGCQHHRQWNAAALGY